LSRATNQGRLPVRREQIPLRSLLESAASLFASSSLLAGTRIVVDGPERTVDVDPPGARQALVNPLDNALRHTEGGDLAQVQGDRLDSG
jgi:signal transduction histidine kinase